MREHSCIGTKGTAAGLHRHHHLQDEISKRRDVSDWPSNRAGWNDGRSAGKYVVGRGERRLVVGGWWLLVADC